MIILYDHKITAKLEYVEWQLGHILFYDSDCCALKDKMLIG